MFNRESQTSADTEPASLEEAIQSALARVQTSRFRVAKVELDVDFAASAGA